MAKPGPPKKTLNDLPKDWRDTLRESYSHGGGGDARAMRDLKIGTDTFRRFVEEEDEFRAIVEEGHRNLEVIWRQLGHDLARGTVKGNSAVWIFNMKNRFGWADKSEVSGPNGGPVEHAHKPDFSNVADEELEILERIASKVQSGQDSSGGS